MIKPRISLPKALISTYLFGLVLAFGLPSAADTQPSAEYNVQPTLTVTQPTDPVSSKPGSPILISISAHLGPEFNGLPSQTIVPEFHFVAPEGNAVLLHRDLVETDGVNLHINPSSAINIPSEVQKKGAVITGGWSCDHGKYHITFSAYILDSNGGRSNSIKYTLHCNGG